LRYDTLVVVVVIHIFDIGFYIRGKGESNSERWCGEAARAPLEPWVNGKTGGGRAAGTMEAET
jgi:hypothetical protein